MLFNSIHFLIFFPIVVLLYFSMPYKYRWFLLLLASYYFYMSWKAEYAILLLVATFINYLAALFIFKSKNKFYKKIWLIFSLVGSLSLLFTFKYFNFISDSVSEFLSLFSVQFSPLFLNVLLPVGISFYTFQTIGYTIDVYRSKIKPEKHFGIFAVYVSFFPQLVAGPIERAKNLMPQFFEKHNFDYSMVVSGLRLMLWGFFLKLVVADRLALLVNTIYNNPTSYTGLPLVLATVFFAFQIYGDFAGYSLIAIGAAQIMGFRLMNNFKRPYFSKSVEEFWERWHISLSSWWRDYLYIPLGGNRVKVSRMYFNIAIVFLIAGLWHGANWTFLIWGALHGFYLIIFKGTKNIRKKFLNKTKLSKYSKLLTGINIFITFILVVFAWIFFRANTLQDALYIITHLFSNFKFNLAEVNLGLNMPELILAFGSIAFMGLVHLIQEYSGMKQFLLNRSTLVKWIIYFVVLFSILLFGVFQEIAFIYFQF